MKRKSEIGRLVLSALMLVASTRVARGQPGPCPIDSGRAFVPRWMSNQDSLRRLLTALDQRIATARDDDLPPLLLARGLARTWYLPPRPRPVGQADTVAPPGYVYDEIGARFLYGGQDFRDLIQRFPTNELVDRAAYGLTLLQLGGECEGDLVCAIDWHWGRISTFLRSYPRSRLADSALDRAIAVFRLIRPSFDLRSTHHLSSGQSDFDWTPDEIPPLIESLDDVAAVQIGAGRTRLLIRAAELWTQIANVDRARSTYTAAQSSATVAQRACIRARLHALPNG